MTYAKYTKVSVEKTQWAIIELLKKHGAKGFMMDFESNRIGFQVGNRNVIIKMDSPDKDNYNTDNQYEQAIKTKWRAFLLIIKAKFVGIDSGVTTFDNEFMPHFILQNGKTLGEVILPQLDLPDMFPKLPEGDL